MATVTKTKPFNHEETQRRVRSPLMLVRKYIRAYIILEGLVLVRPAGFSSFFHVSPPFLVGHHPPAGSICQTVYMDTYDLFYRLPPGSRRQRDVPRNACATRAELPLLAGRTSYTTCEHYADDH